MNKVFSKDDSVSLENIQNIQSERLQLNAVQAYTNQNQEARHFKLMSSSIGLGDLGVLHSILEDPRT